MLKLLRHKRVAKIVLWAILILILPAFVIWGTGSLGRSKEKGPTFVGLINNKKVTFDDFADSIMSMRAQILLNFFNQRQVMDALLKNSEFVGKMAWDRLIMLKEAKARHIRVTDSEVIAFIRTMPIFLRDGKFDERLYGYVLRNNLGLAPRSFEEMMRENITIQKLHELLTKDVKISDEEVLNQYKSDNKILEAKDFDEEKFKKEKDEYAKKALLDKKNKSLESWLKTLESKNVLKIDLKDYEKYYK